MRRLLAVAAAVLCASCARPGDPVKALLDGAAKDAEKRDAGALAARLSSDFRAGDGEDRAAMELTFRRLFFAYTSVGVKLSDVQVERSPDAARVALRADFSGSPREGGLAGLLPRASTWRVDLRLVREGDAWRISQASWRPLEASFP